MCLSALLTFLIPMWTNSTPLWAMFYLRAMISPGLKQPPRSRMRQYLGEKAGLRERRTTKTRKEGTRARSRTKTEGEGTGPWMRTKNIIGSWKSTTNISSARRCGDWTRYSRPWPLSLALGRHNSAAAITRRWRRSTTPSLTSSCTWGSSTMATSTHDSLRKTCSRTTLRKLFLSWTSRSSSSSRPRK